MRAIMLVLAFFIAILAMPLGLAGVFFFGVTGPWAYAAGLTATLCSVLAMFTYVMMDVQA